jgi:ribosome-associated translation inhibitor RaiA
MDIEIRARGLKLSAAQREHAERRVGAALDRFEHRLRTVTVTLEDLNGPKGGADTRCRVRARGDRGLAALAQATDVSVEAAADRAADAIGRNVAKVVDRRRDFGGRDRTSVAGERRRR